MTKVQLADWSAFSDRSSRTTQVYLALRTAISSGELPPRERLYEKVIAKQLKVSRTPVREALQRLVSEGLAETGPEGVCVAALSAKDVRSLEQTNRALQGLAAELAAREGSEDDMVKLEEHMARMEACAAVRDANGWAAADFAIHRHIFQMTDNRWLVKLRMQMEPLTDRVRHIEIRRPGRMEESALEHRAIVEAIKTRDGAAARQAMSEHLVLTERNLLEILETFVLPLLNAGGGNGISR